MTNGEAEMYDEAELEAEFERLFPHGFAGPDVLKELAPEVRSFPDLVSDIKAGRVTH